MTNRADWIYFYENRIIITISKYFLNIQKVS